MASGPESPPSPPRSTSAHALADLLEAGGFPPPIAVPLRLEHHEACYAADQVVAHQFLASDVTYNEAWLFGTGAAGLTLGAASLVRNSVVKNRAKREAAPQWRPVPSGWAYVTNQRIAIQSEQGWWSIWFANVMQATCDRTAIVLEGEGWPPTRLATPDVDHLFVLLWRLLYGQVTRPPAVGTPV